uniref:THO complex 7 n=1 Tax=Mycena chlorophos TaxID=658473 RepID=A0ABQ0M9A6_MYCCL|nr:THO complex 7 [Mycena chlorophos]
MASDAPTHPILPLTAEQEDQTIHARITNDERPLRRVIKKLYNYTSLAYPPIVPHVPVPGSSTAPQSVEDAREAFVLELGSFRLMLQKSGMICDAEERQVAKYKRDKEKIDREHGILRAEIEELKTGLEHEQKVRKQKMDYDFVAEKVNSLPSRAELELSINSLENDMATIRIEHENQDRAILAQKAALDQLVESLEALKALGRGIEQDITAEEEVVPGDGADGAPATSTAQLSEKGMEEVEEGEEPPPQKPADDDIEMGEVEESPKKGKKRREELEEGEASDGSSELSEPPE